MSDTANERPQSDAPPTSTIAEEKNQFPAEPINNNPIEVTSFEQGRFSPLVQKHEILIFAFILDLRTSKLSARAYTDSIEFFQKLPELTRAELMESMNRLYVSYTNRMKGITT